MRTDFNNLLARRDELDNDFLRAMVELLTTYGKEARIAFIPEGFAEGDEITDYDDFPVTMTLWGKSERPNIDVTEMYLSDNCVTVFARGIDTSTGHMHDEDFEIYADHYHDALGFMLIALEQQGVKF